VRLTLHPVSNLTLQRQPQVEQLSGSMRFVAIYQ
jgi:hypothetical protein